MLPLSVGDLVTLLHDLHAQHEAVDELVLLKEAARHVDVGVEQDLVQQDLETLFQHAALLGRFDGGVEKLNVERDQNNDATEIQRNICLGLVKQSTVAFSSPV